MSNFDSRLTALATQEQALASDPTASVFLSANAGTGKTKVLTDRVLRLLLAGAKADGILCVTYTRAAAAEMRNRIAARLAKWTVIPTAELTADLANMGVATPSQEMIRRARSLFAEILDNDNGPRVDTVHSFCQSILRRFPIEAGIAPNAVLADDVEQARLKAIARDTVLRALDDKTIDAVATLAAHSDEANLEELLDGFLSRASDLDNPDLVTAVTKHFEDDLHVGDAASIAAMLGEIVATIDSEKLRAVAMVLSESGVAGQMKRGAGMQAWLGLDHEGRCRQINLLTNALFGGSGPYSERVLSNKNIRQVMPDVVAVQQDAQDKLTQYLTAIAGQRCRELTEALYHYGTTFLTQYQSVKMVRGVLDYDDLIQVTNRLLDRSEAAQWVAWKLDNGIRHLLIDEAQDTSPAQWALLRKLSDEFFDDDPDAVGDEPARTIFAVGDFKQSIYSFLGADPSVMNRNREELAARAQSRDVAFRSLSLSVSFRSAGPVLDLVNASTADLPGIQDFVTHRLARSTASGFIELWPLTKTEQDKEEIAGFMPPPIDTASGASAIAAQQLARTVNEWIGTRQLSDGRPMQAGDVLILLAKRDRFFEQVLTALQSEGVAVAGADRLKLEEQIEIQDLLALADVILLPEDDLQLAVLLKSPLIGLDEEMLFTLAHHRGDASLFARLMEHAGADSPFGVAADRLSRWRGMADRMSVFAFYSQILLGGGRTAFRARLGSAVSESLDHFLNLAQNANHMGLAEFVANLRKTGGEVKRDLDAGQADEVRVMTIHGAKGLEAPVVFLPDMLTGRSRTDPLVQAVDGRFLYMSPGAELRTGFLDQAKDAARATRDEEANRLLYVALTRARDAVVIGGWESRARTLKGSNYEHLSTILAEVPDVTISDDNIMRLAHIGTDQSADQSQLGTPGAGPEFPADLSWLHRPAPIDPLLSRPLRPSEPGSNFQPQPLVLPSGSRNIALARGRFAHRLFEVLPALPAARRADAITSLVAKARDLSPEEAQSAADEVMAVIHNPSCARLFAADALVEVAINGTVGSHLVAGQIDRCHIGADDIVIADFKTGRPSEGPVPPTYCRQMALYAALLGQIYPDRPITCWLVWTETASIQEIPEAARSEALCEMDGIG